MIEIIDLNSKRPPVVYRVTIVHHYDDTLEFRVEDVADDPRSREAVMSAFRRISGADEEIEKLRTDVRHAVFADSEYAAEMDEQNAALRKENARLRSILATEVRPPLDDDLAGEPYAAKDRQPEPGGLGRIGQVEGGRDDGGA